MQKVTPFLWFDGQAEEAMNYYVSIFPNSKIVNTNPMGGMFEIDGQQFMTLNGGPMYKFTEAISLYVNCEAQEEVDELWEKLSAGGEKGRCGWLKDKYGLSWQIIPSALWQLMRDPDQAKAGRVMQAMMQMTKIDIAGLKKAYDQE
jgi:predicted 3-demethylubiquinone-9 3-methyltransferase (glyoxalase superfamily)